MFNVTKKHNALVQIVSLDSEYHGFKGIIEDLSKCNSIVFQDNIINQQNGSILVKDILSNKVTIYLSIPENLRTSLQMDQKKLERQKENLTKELSKMNRMISGSTYELNVTLDVQKLHKKKVAVLEEKIARIDYVLSIL
ncbi:hypothetical protein HHI36_018633 [Cryptolaemus montrouzieri]|uniref:Uncharacterized protein n=1 Tax=Cryptolaemus montrouzieri TaxID=559131 RepID=A0ABD2P1B7_9CUCU